MPIVIWTPFAASELEDILLYIAIDRGRPSTAAKINIEIEQRIKLFAENPELGQRLDGFAPDWRYCRHKRWVIVYRPVENGVEVLRVIDCSRDFPALFGD